MYHTWTRIYRSSLELVELAQVVINQLPSGHGFLADQLRRAAASVTLNFAEGSGKRTTRDRRKYFDTAKASAYEVAAVFDVAVRLGVIDAQLAQRGTARCDQLAAMISRYR